MVLTRRRFMKIAGGALAGLSLLPVMSKAEQFRLPKTEQSPIWYSGTPHMGCSGWIMESDDKARLLHQFMS
jgi:hypothetical protein